MPTHGVLRVVLLALLATISSRGFATAQDPLPTLPERALFQLGDDRLHHRGTVEHIQFSPDGMLIAATAWGDSAVRVWNAVSGAEVVRLDAGDPNWHWPVAVAFSPDGTQLLAGYLNGTVALWDVAQHKLLYQAQRHRVEASAVAFSPDGSLFVSGGGDSWLHASLTKAPEEMTWSFFGSTRPHPGDSSTFDGGVADARFSADGAHVVLGMAISAKVVGLNAGTGKPEWTIDQAHNIGRGRNRNRPLQSLALTPDGRQLITFGHRTVAQDELPAGVPDGGPHTQIGEVHVWDLATGTMVQNLLGTRLVRSTGDGDLSPDGAIIALAGSDEIELISTSTGEVLRTMPTTELSRTHPVFSPNGTHVAVGVEQVVAVWNVATGERLLHNPADHQNAVSVTGYSAGDFLLTAAGREGAVRLWNVEDGTHRRDLVLGKGALTFGACFSGDGRLVVACGAKDPRRRPIQGTARVWNTDGTLVSELDFETVVEHVAVSVDGSHAAFALNNGALRNQLLRIELWQVNPPQLVVRIPPNERQNMSPPAAMTFSPDGGLLHVAESDGTVSVWNAVSGTKVRSFVAIHPEEQPAAGRRPIRIREAAFSADGQRLVIVSGPHIDLWDVAAGTLKGTMSVPEAQHGFRIGISADGRLLAASENFYPGEPGSDVVRIIDLETQQVVLAVTPVDARAMSLTFSPDSQRLITGFDNGTAMVWDVSR